MRHSIADDDLLRLLSYDPSTGEFSWRVDRGKVRAGSIAGRIDSSGYKQLCVKYRRILAHRLAWFFVHGKWPSGQIDHINRERLDNRIENLRVADIYEQRQNRLRPSKSSKSGLLGVRKEGKKWRSTITVYGERHHLGMFDSPEIAQLKYLEAKKQLHPAFVVDGR
jgi:HNH endonuclease